MSKKTRTAILLSLFLASAVAQAKAPKASKPEEADVGAIKNRYWAQGEESELAVVQNRLYTKSGKLELGVFGGILGTDPFLNAYTLGGSLGYHFTEIWSLSAFGWKTFVSPSGALKTLEATHNETANTNNPHAFYGAEIGASILYGKLSLVGKKILYYDMNLLGGAGLTDTETGTYFTPSIGVGQQIWMADFMSLRIDYRLMPYRENIVEKVLASKLGQVVDSRMNWTNSVTLGLTFLL